MGNALSVARAMQLKYSNVGVCIVLRCNPLKLGTSGLWQGFGSVFEARCELDMNFQQLVEVFSFFFTLLTNLNPALCLGLP